MNNALWLIVHSTVVLTYYSYASIKLFMGYMIMLICYIRHVKMQLKNDQYRSISWYRPFVALQIQINIARSSY